MISIVTNDINKDACVSIRNLAKGGEYELINSNIVNKTEAFNKSIEQITGDYVIFIEDGDTIDINTIQSLNSELMRYNPDIAFCDFLGLTNKNITILIHPNTNYCSPRELQFEILSGIYPDTLSNVLFRAKLLKDFNITFQNVGCFTNMTFLGQFLSNEVKLNYFQIAISTIKISSDFGKSGQLNENQFKDLPLYHNTLKTIINKQEFEKIIYNFKCISLKNNYISLKQFANFLPLSFYFMTDKKFRLKTRVRNMVSYILNKFHIRFVRMGVI